MSVSLVKSDFKAILSLVPLQTTDRSMILCYTLPLTPSLSMYKVLGDSKIPFYT